MRQGITFWECMEVVPNGVRILILVSLVLLYSTKSSNFIGHDRGLEEEPGYDTEITRLLNPRCIKSCRGNS